MKTTLGKCILVGTALILGMARVALLPAIIFWLVTAGTVLVFEKLYQTNKRTKKP
ncbi:MAG: hypothetical protein JSV03_02910 [Planctomycetota bacterium]|nr:MAG: hypothetical protein JSV03_02910 [Planctomycetota bacterium]